MCVGVCERVSTCGFTCSFSVSFSVRSLFVCVCLSRSPSPSLSLSISVYVLVHMKSHTYIHRSHTPLNCMRSATGLHHQPRIRHGALCAHAAAHGARTQPVSLRGRCEIAQLHITKALFCLKRSLVLKKCPIPRQQRLILHQKSPILHQKSRILHRKSRITRPERCIIHQKSPYSISKETYHT